jgi:hypothetical protein
VEAAPWVEGRVVYEEEKVPYRIRVRARVRDRVRDRVRVSASSTRRRRWPIIAYYRPTRVPAGSGRRL